MKVKVGNKIYDGEEEPVMVILTQKDKENIANMLPDAMKYAMTPESFPVPELDKWMNMDQDSDLLYIICIHNRDDFNTVVKMNHLADDIILFTMLFKYSDKFIRDRFAGFLKSNGIENISCHEKGCKK